MVNNYTYIKQSHWKFKKNKKQKKKTTTYDVDNPAPDMHKNVTELKPVKYWEI